MNVEIDIKDCDYFTVLYIFVMFFFLIINTKMRFETIPKEVIAIRFEPSGTNPEEILKFIKKFKNITRPYIVYGVEQNLIRFFFNDGRVTIEPGMWLVVEEDSLFYGSENDFKSKYRRKIVVTDLETSSLITKIEEELPVIKNAKSTSIKLSVIISEFFRSVGIKIV